MKFGAGWFAWVVFCGLAGVTLLVVGIAAIWLKLTEPSQRSLADMERDYIEFVHAEINPMVERDKLRHLAGGCEVGEDDLLCVECYLPGGEAWTRCTASGCYLVDTGPEVDAAGADIGVCERPLSRQGLALTFTRRQR